MSHTPERLSRIYPGLGKKDAVFHSLSLAATRGNSRPEKYDESKNRSVRALSAF